MRKEKIINGQKFIYSEQSAIWFSEYKEVNGINYKFDQNTMTYIPLIEAGEQKGYDMEI